MSYRKEEDGREIIKRGIERDNERREKTEG